jgi:tetratricopeptide (TPR) repeat protein
MSTTENTAHVPALTAALENQLTRTEDSLDSLIERPEDLQRTQAAIPKAKRIAAIRQKYQGASWWQTRDADRRYEELQELLEYTPEQRNTVIEADRLASEVDDLSLQERLQKPGEAVRNAMHAVELFRSVSGTREARYGAYLAQLADVYHDLVLFKDAENYYLQILDLRRKTLGEEHPQFAEVYEARRTKIQAENRNGSASTGRRGWPVAVS